MPKVGRANKGRCLGGIILHLLVVRSVRANARGIALEVAQPGPGLDSSVAVAPIQPVGICKRLEATNTMRVCHFAMRVCVKIRNATQVLDDHLGSIYATLTTLGVVGRVGHCLSHGEVL